MKKIFFPRNENGMSLVSVMVASVLGIILFMGITSGIQAMYAAQKNVDMASTAINVSDQLRIRFDSPEACNASMIGQTYTPAGTNSISGISISVNGQTATLTNGSEVVAGLGWSVSSVELETSNSSAQAQDVVLKNSVGTDVTYKKYAGAIKIQFVRTDGSAQAPVPVYIPVVFLGDDGTNTIAGCGQTAMGQIMCKSMGYVWRGDLSPAVCMKANECVFGGSYVNSSITAAQGGFDNPITGGRSCIDTSYTPVRSGTVTFANKTGKYGFQSVVGEVYDCLKCLDANGNVTPPAAPAALAFGSSFNADPDVAAAEGDVTSVDGAMGGCTMTMPAWPPYWMAPMTIPVPCGSVSTTTTTTTLPICDPWTQPFPHWGVKFGLCYGSCGQIGGTSSFSDLCSNHGKLDAGIAWDVNYCCVDPTTTTTTLPPPTSCPPKLPGGYVFGNAPYVLCANDSAIPSTPIGGSVTLTDSMPPLVGTYTVMCPASGIWPILTFAGGCAPTTTTTTTLPPPTACAPVAPGGYVFGYAPYVLCANDSAIPSTPIGGSVTLTDSTPPRVGTFTVTCPVSGIWPGLTFSGGCM